MIHQGQMENTHEVFTVTWSCIFMLPKGCDKSEDNERCTGELSFIMDSYSLFLIIILVMSPLLCERIKNVVDWKLMIMTYLHICFFTAVSISMQIVAIFNKFSWSAVFPENVSRPSQRCLHEHRRTTSGRAAVYQPIAFKLNLYIYRIDLSWFSIIHLDSPSRVKSSLNDFVIQCANLHGIKASQASPRRIISDHAPSNSAIANDKAKRIGD